MTGRMVWNFSEFRASKLKRGARLRRNGDRGVRRSWQGATELEVGGETVEK